MMRITIEIVPFGEEIDKRTIHTIVVGNMGKVGDPDVYQYSIKLDGADCGTVHHRRSLGAVNLSSIVIDHLDFIRILKG